MDTRRPFNSVPLGALFGRAPSAAHAHIVANGSMTPAMESEALRAGRNGILVKQHHHAAVGVGGGWLRGGAWWSTRLQRCARVPSHTQRLHPSSQLGDARRMWRTAHREGAAAPNRSTVARRTAAVSVGCCGRALSRRSVHQEMWRLEKSKSRPCYYEAYALAARCTIAALARPTSVEAAGSERGEARGRQ